MKKNYHHLITIFLYAAIAVFSIHIYSFGEIPRGREFTHSVFKPFIFFCVLPWVALCLFRSAGVLTKTVSDSEVDDYWTSYYRGKHRMMSEDKVVMALSDGEKALIEAQSNSGWVLIDLFKFIFTVVISVAIGVALFGITVVYWMDFGSVHEIYARAVEGFDSCSKNIAAEAKQTCFSLFLVVVFSACIASVAVGAFFYFRFIAFPSIQFVHRKLTEIRLIKGFLASGDPIDEVIKKGRGFSGRLRLIKTVLGIWFEQHGRLGQVVIALHVWAAIGAVAFTVSLFRG